MSASDVTTLTKICTSCGRELPATLEFFYHKKRGRFGLEGKCVECRRRLDRAYYLAHSEERKAYARGQSKAYYMANRERVLKRCRAYQKAHLEAYAEHARRARERDPEAVREYQRAYIAANREQHNAKARRRRAIEAGAAGGHTAEDVHIQYERQGGKCFYCSCRLGDRYHVEHVVPLVLGGSNGPENIVMACPECNLAKGSKHPMDFAGILF